MMQNHCDQIEINLVTMVFKPASMRLWNCVLSFSLRLRTLGIFNYPRRACSCTKSPLTINIRKAITRSKLITPY